MSAMLITSASAKVPLIDFISEKCKINKIFLSDSDVNSITGLLYENFIHLKPYKDLNIGELLDICKKREIKYIIPTSDLDVRFFSKYNSILNENGIYVMVSPEESIMAVNDKLLFAEVLKKAKFPYIETSVDITSINSSRYVLKDRYGYGSNNIYIDIGFQEAKCVATTMDNPIFQPYIVGREYSIDMYVTLDRQIKGSIVRERILVRNGESKVTKTIDNNKLEEVCSKIAKELNLYGHLIFQALITEDEDIYIIECNARVGGASTLSFRAGLDSINWFINECNKESLDNYLFVKRLGLTQVRYMRDIVL